MDYIETEKTKRVIAEMLNMSSYDIELTPEGFTMRRFDFTSQLRALHNRDFAAYKREVYARRAEQYRKQAIYQYRSVVDLFNHFNDFRKWLNSGTEAVPAEYAGYGSFQLRRDVHGTMRQEWLIVLPESVFGLHLLISLDYLIDLLRVLKSHYKLTPLQLRAVPITPRLTGNRGGQDVYHYSALEIHVCDNTFHLFSETQPEFDI